MKKGNLTDKQLLYYKMRDAGYTAETLSKKVGISRASFCLKANGKREFTANEIYEICRLLNITDVVPVFLRSLG